MSIVSVSEANKYIKKLFDEDGVLRSIFIRGEISNFKRHHSGHCYFTLKDSEAMLRAVMFRSRAQFLKFLPKDGQKVIAGGSIAVFERDGQYQMYAEQLIPDGVGELSLAFEQLKDRLAAEGLFDVARKKDLPVFPSSIGIITSPTGAAVRDIITVAKRRNPGIALVLYPVQVQGVEAPEQIVQALRIFNSLQSVEVIIIGRGGGSLEELWAFNDERVVRAIAASEIPVVSGVGHETDVTLADFAADKRAATPSQAAELVVPDVRELQRYIIALKTMLVTHIRRAVKTRLQHVTQVRGSRAFSRPRDMLQSKQQTVDLMINRLHYTEKKIFQDKQHRFQLAAEKLSMLSPLSVLARGYSITRGTDGKIIYSTQEVQAGQKLEVVLSHGRLDVCVLDTEEENNVNPSL